nr:hypothetical protein BaRGS_027994 [Batillaria attramentaria]
MLDGAALTSDFFKVNCVSGGGQRYSNVHSGVAANPDIHKRLEEHASAARDEERRRDPSVTSQGLGLSVFMFGFDSTSRMSWIRNLPRTREYFLNSLGGIELEGYNIVGDGTPAALLPILTGKVEEELPEARRGHAGAKQLDGHPWVEPTYKNQEPLCLGSTPRHVNFLNWFRDLFDMYHKYPKMFFGFHSEFSHGSGCKLQAMDDDLLSFLKNLEKKGYLNSTLLILMADHGARFHDLRVTKQGNLEERMPYFSFRFPPWFRKQHPDIVRNVEINSHRLTTPFDIHATFMDILDYKGPGVANISQRGVSLFREIPEKRTCSDAYIAPHWCACLDWQDVDQQDANVQKAVKTAVDTINSYTASSRRSCAELRLDEITSSAKYITSTNDYKTEKIMRNYLANDQAQKDVLQSYVSTLKGNAELYQVSFITQPGHGQFEVTCVRDVTSDTFTVSSNAISRLNKYGSAPACIEKRFPHLRPYCYCS